MVELKENFVIFLTLFVLSLSLPKFLLLFGTKPLFMLLIPNLVVQNQTPYERLFGSPPDYHHLRSFGSACFILLQLHKHKQTWVLILALLFSWLWQNSKGLSVLWSCLSSFSYHPQCCFLGTSLLCWALLLSCLPIYLICLRSFSRWATYSFYSCS